MRYDEAEVLRVAKISAANLVRTADIFKVIIKFSVRIISDVIFLILQYF